MKRILIAPDSFKDALTAEAACERIAAGLRAVTDARLDLCPLADGGEGSGRILASARRCDLVTETVHDPLHRPRTATWYHHAERNAAVIEMAEASGLMHLAAEERDPRRTSTFGTGELLAAAARRGCHSVEICVGGSATVDAGCGCLQALGWTFWDPAGEPLPAPLTGGDLARIAGLAAPLEPPQLAVTVLCDVDNPLLGPAGAAAVFGPQKGATPAAVAQLEQGLTACATLFAAATGTDVAARPGCGAAGGLPAGLVAALDARIVSGFDTIAAALDLQRRIAAADLIITGEGRLDAQSSRGKVVGQVAARCREAGRPVAAIAGTVSAAAAAELGLLVTIDLSPEGPLPGALAETAARLPDAARALLEKVRGRTAC